MRIEKIQPWQLPRTWHHILPLIQKALNHSLGEQLASDMLQPLMEDGLWLLAGIDEQGDLAGVIVAEEIVHPQKKELYVQYADIFIIRTQRLYQVVFWNGKTKFFYVKEQLNQEVGTGHFLPVFLKIMRLSLRVL